MSIYKETPLELPLFQRILDRRFPFLEVESKATTSIVCCPSRPSNSPNKNKKQTHIV